MILLIRYSVSYDCKRDPTGMERECYLPPHLSTAHCATARLFPQLVRARGNQKGCANSQTSFSPQSLQNLLPMALTVLHFEQVIGSSDFPHEGQNFESFGISDLQ